MVWISAGDFEKSVVNHDNAEGAQRYTRRYLNLIHVVNAEAAGLLDPVFDERVAQSVLGLRFGKIRAFDD